MFTQLKWEKRRSAKLRKALLALKKSLPYPFLWRDNSARDTVDALLDSFSSKDLDCDLQKIREDLNGITLPSQEKVKKKKTKPSEETKKNSKGNEEEPEECFARCISILDEEYSIKFSLLNSQLYELLNEYAEEGSVFRTYPRTLRNYLDEVRAATTVDDLNSIIETLLSEVSTWIDDDSPDEIFVGIHLALSELANNTLLDAFEEQQRKTGAESEREETESVKKKYETIGKQKEQKEQEFLRFKQQAEREHKKMAADHEKLQLAQEARMFAEAAMQEQERTIRSQAELIHRLAQKSNVRDEDVETLKQNALLQIQLEHMIEQNKKLRLENERLNYNVCEDGVDNEESTTTTTTTTTTTASHTFLDGGKRKKKKGDSLSHEGGEYDGISQFAPNTSK